VSEIDAIMKNKDFDDDKKQTASKMLNHIGSNIDDVEMDQPTFFKIFHSLRSEESLFLNRFIALEPR
jgi:hypothetical protein